MKTRLKLATITLLTAQLVCGPTLAQREGGQPFTRLTIADVHGRVGHHLTVLGIFIRTDDLPAGNSGDAFAGTCNLVYQYASHTGDLPPGLTMDHVPGAPYVSGTPRQPGTWLVTTEFDVGCQGGPDLTRYRRQVRANFHIEP